MVVYLGGEGNVSWFQLIFFLCTGIYLWRFLFVDGAAYLNETLVFSRAVVNSIAIQMEIFFGEISSLLTRFGILRHFD